MAAVTIKNIPDDLYGALKKAAQVHHRSINSELIACLEQVLRPVRLSSDEMLVQSRRLRGQIPCQINEDELIAAKNHGRE